VLLFEDQLAPMLDDLLAADLKLVICGSAPGTRSTAMRAHYAGRGNRFWRTLGDVGLTSTLLEPNQSRELLTFSVGLTDLVKEQSGMDHRIRFTAAASDALRSRIVQHRRTAIAFHEKRAAPEFFQRNSLSYGLQDETIGGAIVFVAPSTSGAATRYWDIALWRELATIAADLHARRNRRA
jgi:TDG/mug DNA glycosylase family protein